jgi:hypothetical protein
MCRRFHHPLLALSLCAAGAAALQPVQAAAQRHNGLSSPPTAPHRRGTATANQPIVPVSSGMGALEFATVNYGVPAPQSLTRQMEADDDRTRAAALSAIGAPAQYLVRGHIPYPHDVQLDLVALGVNDELDAILTVELDQHIVSAVLVPQGDNWHRVATIIDPTPFSDPRSTPATFLRIARSLIQHERYRAIYRAVTTGPNGDFTENEAHLRVLNSKAVILISFASSERACDTGPRHTGCALTRRWLQPDPDDPAHRFILVTGSGRLTPHEAAEPLADATTFQQAHLRTFSCQPYIYMDNSQHYEPTANSAPCPLK